MQPWRREDVEGGRNLSVKGEGSRSKGGGLRGQEH